MHVSGLGLPYRDSKFCVFVTVSPNQFFLINSKNRQMYDCIPLLKNGRKFPRHDSFIACSRVFQADDSQIDSHHGALEDNELQLLMTHVNLSKTLTGIQKKQITSAIAAELIKRS